jgi:hypothetical protein
MAPPRRTDGDACVVNVGAAITANVVASSESFSEFGSEEEVTLATFV